MDIDPSMPFSQAFEFASAKTNSRFTNPLWRLDAALFGRSFRDAVAQVRAFGSEVVTKANAQLQKAPSKTEPLRTSLIKALLTHIPDQKTVADSATNFLSAGRDTTAQSMSWTAYELLKNPEALQKLVQALQATFPHKSRSEPLNITFEEATNPHFLTYISAAFAEALRLNPAVPLEIKESTAPCILPDGTNLPAGAAVIWIPFAMARSPTIWGPDATRFVPERWTVRDGDGNDVIMQKNAFENPVFNAGPRMCIGKRMAEVLALKILAELFWRWDLELVDSKKRVVGESLTAPMQGGLPVRVHRVVEAIMQ
jgi:cytochrome P450